MHVEGRKPARELTMGEIITQTFALYSEKFGQYLVPFLVSGAIVGLLTTAITYVITIPPVPTNPIRQQTFAWLETAFSPLFILLFGTFIAWWVIVASITQGMAIKFTQELLEMKNPSLQESYSFVMSRLLKLVIVGVMTGISIFIGLIALILPGVIIAIIFSLVVPAIIIEDKGIRRSFSRSRLLVSCRWLKTFSLLLLLYVTIGVASMLVAVISIPFGIASILISSILAAFIQPILPIALTVHYYSTIARTIPQELNLSA